MTIYCDGNIETIQYGVGKTNCLTEIPHNINLELDPLNVTVVGSPTISNGVVSGFSTSNYLMTPSINIGTNDFESLYKFKFGEYNSSTEVYQLIARTYNSGYNYAVAVAYDTTNNVYRCHLNWGNMTTWTGPINSNTTLTVGKDYWVKVERKNGNISLYLSEDGITYTLEGSKASTEDFGTHQHTLGVMYLNNATTTNQVMYGSIDIANSYVKVNDEICWKGGTGSLTLKKGSKVYVPNGKNADNSNKFDEVVIGSDIVASNYTGYTYTAFACYVPELNKILLNDAYTGSGNGFEYNVQENYLRLAGDWSNDAYAGKLTSLPLGLIEMTSAVGVTSIIQIFDWCGYIGRSWFILNNTKGLQANGLNSDGTYKSIARTASSVLVHDINPAWGNVGAMKGLWWGNNTLESQTVGRFSTNKTITGQYVYTYVESENYWYYTNDSGTSWVGPNSNIVVADMNFDGTQITSFTPYEVKTTNDTINIKEVHQCVGKTNCLTEIPHNINLELDPLNVTVVGSPTISNGVVSGFTTANYLLTPNSVDLNTVDNFEIVVRAKHGTGSLLQQHSNTPYTIALQCGMMLVRLNGGSAWTNIYENNTGLVEGNWYTIRASFDGLVYKFERAEDNGEFITLATLENSTKIISNNQSFILGINDVHSDPYLGSIDIPNCYIKINDQMWWKGGTGNLTLKAGSKVYIPNGWEQTDYYKHNVTKIGNIIESKSNISGFGVDNYLQLPNSFITDNNTWEVCIEFTSYGLGARQRIFNSTTDFVGVMLVLEPAGTFTLALSSGNTSWDISALTSTNTVVANKTYKAKIAYTGTQYTLDIYDENWVNYITVDSSVPVSSNTYNLGRSESSSYPDILNGSIDLSQSYIKINDEIWWKGIIEGTKEDSDYVIHSGNRVFDEVVIENDVSHVASTYGSDIHFSCFSPDKNHIQSLIKGTQVFSGNNTPTVSYTYAFWYDTPNNLVKYTTDSGVTWENGWSLPFSISSITTGVGYTSINQIFNGFGYIGSTIFVLPGVKGLSSKGYKNNGVYNNIDILNDKVTILSREFTQTNPILIGNNILNQTYLYYIESDSMPSTNWTIWRNTLTNEIKVCNSVANEFVDLPFDCVYIGTTTRDESFKITDMNILPIPVTNDTKIIYKSDEINF